LVYQLTLRAPAPPAGTVDAAAAARGRTVFTGAAGCARCHQGPAFTDVLSGPPRQWPVLHDPAEVGTEPEYASRTATKRYRTTPLRALFQHAPYFHDGSAATLEAVVEHYDTHFSLGLSAAQKADLVQYLKSL
jgi:cytochrome c peroxidase